MLWKLQRVCPHKSLSSTSSCLPTFYAEFRAQAYVNYVAQYVKSKLRHNIKLRLFRASDKEIGIDALVDIASVLYWVGEDHNRQRNAAWECGIRECKTNKNHHKMQAVCHFGDGGGGGKQGCEHLWLYLEINVTSSSPFPGNFWKTVNFSDNPNKCRNSRAC